MGQNSRVGTARVGNDKRPVGHTTALLDERRDGIPIAACQHFHRHLGIDPPYLAYGRYDFDDGIVGHTGIECMRCHSHPTWVYESHDARTIIHDGGLLRKGKR